MLGLYSGQPEQKVGAQSEAAETDPINHYQRRGVVFHRNHAASQLTGFLADLQRE